MDQRIKRIREKEKKSHESIYTQEELYRTESWLQKPIKTVQDILPLFAEYDTVRVLDLGCGVGRNSIPIARAYHHADCIVECVDILELAIDKLRENAEKYGVAAQMKGYVKSIEEFTIPVKSYDWILAVSALEHIDTEEHFICKLQEIREGIRENGIACLVINSDIRERNRQTGEDIPAQFEINMSTEKMQTILKVTFADWEIQKNTIRAQHYDIPREFGISELTTNVVTLVARKISN